MATEAHEPVESAFGTIGGWRKITDSGELAALAAVDRQESRRRRGGDFSEWGPSYGWAEVQNGVESIGDEGQNAERVTRVLSFLELYGDYQAPAAPAIGDSSPFEQFVPASHREVSYYTPPEPDISEWMTEILPVVTAPESFPDRLKRWRQTTRDWLVTERILWKEDLTLSWNQLKRSLTALTARLSAALKKSKTEIPLIFESDEHGRLIPLFPDGIPED